MVFYPESKFAELARERQEMAELKHRQTLAMIQAAYAGDLQGVEHALENGADLSFRDRQTGLTALHIAVGTDNLPLVRYLVEERRASFVPDGRGRMPTSVAGHCRVSEELCDYIVEQEAAFLEREEVRSGERPERT